MDRYELVEKLLRLGPSYEVRSGGAVRYKVKGSLLWEKPKLSLRDARSGEVLAVLRGNAVRTRFDVKDPSGRVLAKLSFPLLGLERRFEMEVGNVTFDAEGAFLGGDFACRGKGGGVVLAIKKKKLSLRNKLVIETSAAVSPEVAVLAAVAVDQKFFAD